MGRYYRLKDGTRKIRLPTLRGAISQLDLRKTMLWVELDPEQRVAAQRVVDQCVETADNVEPDVYLAAVLHVAVAAYDAVHPEARQ